MPAEWATLTVESQDRDADSTLWLFRRAIEIRHARGELGSSVQWLDMPDDALAFRGADGLTCVLNTGSAAMPLPAGELLIASAPPVDGALAPNAAAWLR
jgi:alpha-glucosidase